MGCLASKLITQGEVHGVKIINKTGKVLELRDREREIYGVRKYRVKPEEHVNMDVMKLGTLNRLSVLVVTGQPERIERTSPRLFIETDEFYRCRIITIEQQIDGKYTLNKVRPRPEDSY